MRLLEELSMLVDNVIYKTIWIDSSEKIKIIDQTYLPYRLQIKELADLNSAVNAIYTMQVRGAPLIGVTAAFGMYLAIRKSKNDCAIKEAGEKLISTRPTAINLLWSVNKLIKIILETPIDQREKKALSFAKSMMIEDEKTNISIGNFGSELIKSIYKKTKKTVNILTHCNAGWLATVDWGTATAPIYKARDMNIPIHVWVDETRPRNQGSFLTSWELKNENIDHTIVVDNTGGHLMQNGLVDIVITGSDRTTYKGDVCNKIGTYLKALAAYDNNIPFYVALPSSTIDWETAEGSKIIIEERDPNEVHFISGIDNKDIIHNVRVSPKNTKAMNFAFDVTPNKYVSGLITEYGVIKANESEILNIKDRLK